MKAHAWRWSATVGGMPSRLPVHFSLLAVLVSFAVGATACTGRVDISFGGQSPAEAAVELIEGEAMAQRLEVLAITNTVCEDPADEEVGATFECTSDSDGQTINFEVRIEEDDRIFAGPTNVIGTAPLLRLETASVQALNRENDFSLPEDSMDCGDDAVILDSEMQMTCLLADPSTDVTYEVLVTVTDVNAGDFSVVIVGEVE